jgi:LysM repeat protein
VSQIVQPGDNLWTFAQRYLGDGSRYPEIARLNGITNPNLIYPGQRLAIPGGGRPPASQVAQAPTARQNFVGGHPATTAELSGGAAFAGIGDQERSILVGAGQIASDAGYDDDARRALQSILLTEGGLSGAVGDSGRSFGPL